MTSCPIYSAGDVSRLMVVEESIYGVTPTTAMKYGGDQTSYGGGPMDIKASPEYLGGLTYDQMRREAPAYGFESSFKFKPVDASRDWANIWVKLACGSVSGIVRDLPSFSAHVFVNKYDRRLFSGCKVNSLTISSGGFGSFIDFKATVWAAGCQESSNGTFSTPAYQTVTPDISAASDTGEAICNLDDPYYTSGGVRMSICAKTWAISINNNLIGTPGKLNGLMTAYGGCLAGDKREIKFTCTVQQSSELWTKSKLYDNVAFELYVPIGGGKTMHLSGCRFSQTDMPTRVQSTNDETLTMSCQGMDVISAESLFEVKFNIDYGGTVSATIGSASSTLAGNNTHRVRVPTGSTLALSETPLSGYTFSGWITADGTDTSSTKNITSAKSVRVVFTA